MERRFHSEDGMLLAVRVGVEDELAELAKESCASTIKKKPQDCGNSFEA